MCYEQVAKQYVADKHWLPVLDVHTHALSLTSQKDVCLHITFPLLYGNKHIVKESKILNQTQKSEEQWSFELGQWIH